MTDIMNGVRILEVAEHTFVPSASAILADWGAEVIKIEHVERGDAMRGLASSGVMKMGGDVHVLLEHSNRGKKSIGIDLTKPQGVEVVYKLAATCDVFLTNKLPAVRKKLRVEADDIRSHNPNIIYVAGTGGGERGPDADRGGYDFLSYWCRAGSAMGCTAPDAESLTVQPGPGYGDSIGGMTIAGGIMGALFHRERTGEALTVDVSLLGVGLWAMGPTVALSLQLGMPWRPPPAGSGAGGPSNPLVGTYRTQDGGFIALSCLQGFHYWPGACRAIGREDLIADERFASNELLATNANVARGHSRHRLCGDAAGRMARTVGRFRRPVVRGAGHSRGRPGPPGRSQRLRARDDQRRRRPVPPGDGAGPVQRDRRDTEAGPRVQRAS